MSTSQKHDMFINGAMGHRRVLAVPGIGQANAQRLQPHGFNMATQLYGRYLQDPNGFVPYLTNTVGMQQRYALACYNGFQGWSNSFLY